MDVESPHRPIGSRPALSSGSNDTRAPDPALEAEIEQVIQNLVSDTPEAEARRSQSPARLPPRVLQPQRTALRTRLFQREDSDWLPTTDAFAWDDGGEGGAGGDREGAQAEGEGRAEEKEGDGGSDEKGGARGVAEGSTASGGSSARYEAERRRKGKHSVEENSGESLEVQGPEKKDGLPSAGHEKGGERVGTVAEEGKKAGAASRMVIDLDFEEEGEANECEGTGAAVDGGATPGGAKAADTEGEAKAETERGVGRGTSADVGGSSGDGKGSEKKDSGGAETAVKMEVATGMGGASAGGTQSQKKGGAAMTPIVVDVSSDEEDVERLERAKVPRAERLRAKRAANKREAQERARGDEVVPVDDDNECEIAVNGGQGGAGSGGLSARRGAETQFREAQGEVERAGEAGEDTAEGVRNQWRGAGEQTGAGDRRVGGGRNIEGGNEEMWRDGLDADLRPDDVPPTLYGGRTSAEFLEFAKPRLEILEELGSGRGSSGGLKRPVSEGDPKRPAKRGRFEAGGAGPSYQVRQTRGETDVTVQSSAQRGVTKEIHGNDAEHGAETCDADWEPVGGQDAGRSERLGDPQNGERSSLPETTAGRPTGGDSTGRSLETGPSIDGSETVGGTQPRKNPDKPLLPGGQSSGGGETDKSTPPNAARKVRGSESHGVAPQEQEDADAATSVSAGVGTAPAEAALVGPPTLQMAGASSHSSGQPTASHRRAAGNSDNVGPPKNEKKSPKPSSAQLGSGNFFSSGGSKGSGAAVGGTAGGRGKVFATSPQKPSVMQGRTILKKRGDGEQERGGSRPVLLPAVREELAALGDDLLGSYRGQKKVPWTAEWQKVRTAGTLAKLKNFLGWLPKKVATEVEGRPGFWERWEQRLDVCETPAELRDLVRELRSEVAGLRAELPAGKCFDEGVWPWLFASFSRESGFSC